MKKRMKENNQVNFKVLGIWPARKPQCVKIDVKFNGNPKVYTYIRKNHNNSVIIDGTRIYFRPQFSDLEVPSYCVTEMIKEYETKGQRKISTANQVTNLSKKIKEEIIEKDIEVPEPIQEIIDVTQPVYHERYDEIKICLENDIPVYLAGPAGSGKNFTVEQIAEELGWNFFFSNSVQQEYKLTGFIDAGGRFHETEFYKACISDKPSIFFLDEVDASIPEVLVLLNAAIANGYFEFPNGRVDFDHVKFVAAGNTVGSGADELYTGRMVIDQATLDRFAIIEFDYSKRIELRLTNNNGTLVNFIRDLRTASEKQGIRATFSYRALIMVTKLEEAKMDLPQIIKIAVVKGLDKDTINTINLYGNSKYHKALEEVQRNN